MIMSTSVCDALPQRQRQRRQHGSWRKWPRLLAAAFAEMLWRQRRAAMACSSCSGHGQANHWAAHGVESPPRPPSRQKTSGMHSPYLDIIKIIHFINLSGYDPFQRGPLPLFSLDMGVMLALLVLMSHGQRSVKTMCPHCLDPGICSWWSLSTRLFGWECHRWW